MNGHIKTSKHTMTININEKSEIYHPPFICNLCDYTTSNKYYMNAHIMTTKHIITPNDNDVS